MKKRILSLILAFAMAATLAPATALVGGNVAKADPNQVVTKVPNADLSVNGTKVTTEAFTVYPGQKIEVDITDKEAGTAGDEIQVERAVTGVGSSAFSKGSSSADLLITRNTKTTVKDVVEISKAAKENTEFEITYTGRYKTSTTGTGTADLGTVKFKVLGRGDITTSVAGNWYTDSNTAKLNKTAPGTLSDVELSIKSGDNGTTYVVGDAKVVVTKIDGADLSITIDGASVNNKVAKSLTPSAGSVKFSFGNIVFAAPAGTVGDSTYKIEFQLSDGTNFNTIATQYRSFTNNSLNEAVLDADGGIVSDTGWELRDGKYYGAAVSAGVNIWNVSLPNARKEGYVFKGWALSVSGALSNGMSVATTSFKAVYDKFTTYTIYSGIGETGSGKADYNRELKTVTNRNLGDKIANAEDKFSRNGYTFLGFSTELGARKALWGPDATLTNEVVQAMESTKRADGSFALYCVWAPKTYEIRFEANMGPTGVALPGSTDKKPITKTFGADLAKSDLGSATWAWEGHTFTHWSLAVSNVTGSGPDVDANGDGKITDAELGNADFSKGYVVLRAEWNNIGSALLYQNDSTFWKQQATTGSLPLYTPEVGKVAEKWVEGDATIASETSGLLANRVYKPVYEKLVSFPIDYKTAQVVLNNKLATASTYFDAVSWSNSDQASFTVGSSTTTVTGYTANTKADDNSLISEATFKGVVYRVKDSEGNWKFVQPDYTLGALSTAMTSKTFNNAKMAALLWSLDKNDYNHANDNYTAKATLEVYPIFAAKVTGAFVAPEKVVVKYGTPIDVLLNDILTTDGTNFGLMGTPSGLASKKIKTGAYSSSISIVNNGGYNPIPDTEKEYVITVRITPGFGTDPNAAYYDKQVRVVVRAGSDAEKSSIFSLTTTLPTITLEAGANAYDVYAALSKVNVFPLKATDGKSYNIDLAEVTPTNGANPKSVMAVKSEWQLDGARGDNADISGLADTYAKYNEAFDGAKTFYFVYKAVSNSGGDWNTNSDNPGLSYQSQTTPATMKYDCKDIVVQINVGAGSVAPFVPAEPVTEDTDERPAMKAGPVYRLWNPNNGDHLFTTNAGERNILAAVGWQVDDVTFNTPASTDENAVPVYRIYNPNSGEHFYTTSKGERNARVKDGWRYEGVEFYAYPSKSNLGVKVYRLFSPQATNAGSHHITGSVGEYNALGKIGWNKEGVAFRAVKAN